MVFACVPGCHDCCGPVIMKKELYDKHNALAERVVNLVDADNGEIVPETSDGWCCFLSNNLCKIHDDKPKICDDYGVNQWLPCPYVKPNGRPRSVANAKHVQRKINHNVNDSMRALDKAFAKRKGQNNSGDGGNDGS